MLQKLHKKTKEFTEEKGQGVVEYAMILGFVAILAIWFLNKSNLITAIQTNVNDAISAANAIHEAYSKG